jgi:hypothetical protein
VVDEELFEVGLEEGLIVESACLGAVVSFQL